MEVIYIFTLVHDIGAGLLLGGGVAIAFFLAMAQRTGHSGVIAVTARFAVAANLILMAAAVVLQPLSGLALAWAIGLSPSQEPWIALSAPLYGVAVGCWLPTVFIAMRIRDLAQAAALKGEPLPARYHRLARLWSWLGLAALFAVLGIFALMIWQPHPF